MELYISKPFNLDEFEAWSGGATTLNTIRELDLLEEAEAYIMEIFAGAETVTETDINDLLWFDMDDFIQSYTEEEEEEEGEF